MTVSTATSTAGPFAGAGTTGPFAVNFYFLEAAHLLVRRTNPDGTVSTLVLNADYTVSGAGNPAGGSVTLASPLAGSYSLRIARNVPATQLTDYTQSDSFPAESHEQALDKLTMLAQQLLTTSAGTVRAPYPEPLTELPDAVTRANKSLAFDSLGQPTVLVPAAGSAAAVLIQLADISSPSNGDALIGWGAITTTIAGVRTRHASLAAAVTAVGSTRSTIVVRGAVSVAASTTIPTTCLLHVVDGGIITIASGQTLTINGGLNCEPVQCFAGTGTVAFGFRIRNVWPEWWGAVADGDGNGGGTNNYAAISQAIASISAMSRQAVVRLVNGGIYRCDTGLSIDVSLHSIKSAGARLDFYNMSASDYALTLNAVANLIGTGSFLAATNYIEGVWFSGRGPSTPAFTRNCILVAGTVSSVVTGYHIRNCNFSYFTNAVSLSPTSNSQAIRFSKNTFLLNDTAVFLPLPTGGAAGSAMLFDDNFFAIGFTGFDLRNPSADVVIRGGNIDGMNVNFIYHLAGSLTCEGVHIETGTDPGVCIYRAPSGVPGYANVRSYLTMSGGIIIAKGTRTAPVFDLSKSGNWTITGGFINVGGATHATPIIDSDASGEGIGNLNISGLSMDKALADTILGVASTITVCDAWGEVKGLAASDWTGRNQDTLTATATNLTTTGAPTYQILYTRFMNRVDWTLRITANGGTTAATAGATYFAATGLPLPSGNASGSGVTTTGVSAGSMLVGPGGGGRLYVGTSWAADGLDRVFSGSYSV